MLPRKFTLLTGIIIFFCIFDFALAQGSEKKLRVSIAKLPVVAENPEKGVLVDMVKAIGRVSGYEVEIEVLPFTRSIRNVVIGKADVHFPIIDIPPQKLTTLDYTLTDVIINHVAFNLYAPKQRQIDMNNLSGLKLYTEATNVDLFDFPIEGDTCVECILKMVNRGRIDGFIFSQAVTDDLIRQLKFTNIRRYPFKEFPVKGVLPKGPERQKTNRLLTDAVNKLRETGEMQRIMEPLDEVYKEWQP